MENRSRGCRRSTGSFGHPARTSQKGTPIGALYGMRARHAANPYPQSSMRQYRIIDHFHPVLPQREHKLQGCSHALCHTSITLPEVCPLHRILSYMRMAASLAPSCSRNERSHVSDAINCTVALCLLCKWKTFRESG
jgi:hypothetical protein